MEILSSCWPAGVGDTIALINQRIASGTAKNDVIWPIDGVHTGDSGYEAFADATSEGYLSSVAHRIFSQNPAKMLYDPT